MPSKCLGLPMIVLTAVLAISLQARSQEPLTTSAVPHLTMMGFRLGKSTITEVQARLGTSRVGRCPDEEGANKEFCYVSGGPDKTTVVFEAGVAGGWTRLDGFRVIAGSRNLNCQLQCTTSNVIRSTIHTGGGLKLGLSRAEVLNLLGKPQQMTRDKLSFQWQSKIRMTSQEIAKTGRNPVDYPYWNVVDTIDVVLVNSRVVEFEIGHSVTD